jgi:hypothetical protein
MLMKIFKRGRGRGAGPVQYLLSDNDAKGQVRPHKPEILKGNPVVTEKLIDSLDFKHKYVSGALSFHIDDKPTEAQQRALIESFEQFAFAGLSQERFNTLWVRHRDENGRVELHFVIPRVDLETGKSYNPTPPGFQRHFSHWKALQNAENRWNEPSETARRRLLSQTGPESEGRAQSREAIHEFLVAKIQAGAVQNRDSILNELKKVGFEVPRAGKNYITVRDPATDAKFRLKGILYEQDFDSKRLIESDERKVTDLDPAKRLQRLTQARVALEKCRKTRESYNHSRYGTGNEKQAEAVQGRER